MNHKRHYERLMVKASKLKGIGLERHRIIPGCLGGKYKKGNFVFLNHREHCLAHLLLTKIYPKNKKLLSAAHLLMRRTRHGSSVLLAALRKGMAEQIIIEAPAAPANMFEAGMINDDHIYSFPINKLVG